MPLIKIEAVAPDVRLGLWKIEETIELFFAANPHLQDLCSRLSDYQSASRRLEILATYGLLFAMTNNSRLSITHYPNGKPHVEGYHVSISHTRGYAVLLISTNKEVAVDIEYYSNRVSRIGVPKKPSINFFLLKPCNILRYGFALLYPENKA